MEEVRKIKGLKSQLRALQSDAELLKIEIGNKQREYGNKLKTIKSIEEQIKSIEKKGNKVKISEHAIVRYFERVRGFDISEIEKEILTEEVLKLIDALGGSGTYPNKEFKVVMKNNMVTTIM